MKLPWKTLQRFLGTYCLTVEGWGGVCLPVMLLKSLKGFSVCLKEFMVHKVEFFFCLNKESYRPVLDLVFALKTFLILNTILFHFCHLERLEVRNDFILQCSKLWILQILIITKYLGFVVHLSTSIAYHAGLNKFTLPVSYPKVLARSISS